MIREDVQMLEPGAKVELYTLDGTAIGGSVLQFQGHERAKIWWQDEEYSQWPIRGTGFEHTGAQQPTPKLRVGNVDGAISFLCMAFDDMLGAVLTRRRTFTKYLDPINFQRNLIIPSVDLDDTGAWLHHEVTVEPDAAIGPLGDMTLDKIVPTAVAEFHHVGRVLPPVDDNAFLSVSVFVRQGDHDAMQLIGYGKDATGPSLAFNFVTGQMQVAHADGQINTFEVQDFGTGLYRLKIGNWNVNTGVDEPTVRVIVGDGSLAGDGVAGTYVGDVQVELAKKVSDYQFLMTLADANPDAAPEQEFPPEVWFINRKSAENVEFVEFELASALDIGNVQLPGRQIIANQCPAQWDYRGPYCAYTGPPVAMIDDTPTDDPDLDRCGKRLQSCRLRLWPDDVMNYGGYPAAALIRT